MRSKKLATLARPFRNLKFDVCPCWSGLTCSEVKLAMDIAASEFYSHEDFPTCRVRWSVFLLFLSPSLLFLTLFFSFSLSLSLSLLTRKY